VRATPPSLRATSAALALLAAAPSAAYVRTTAVGTGVPLAWPVPVVPWALNPAWPQPAPPSCTPGAVLAAAQAGFAQWEQGCANLKLLYAGESAELGVGVRSTGRSVVLFRKGWCSQDPRIVDQSTGRILDPCMNDPDKTCGDLYGCYQDPVTCIKSFQTTGSCTSWSVVALTTVLYEPSSGRILSADIELVGWDGDPASSGQPLTRPPPHGWYFTCDPGAQETPECQRYGDAGCEGMDLQSTITHEAGHFVGLSHPCGENNLPACPAVDPVMAPTTSYGSKGKRTLKADDVAGVCAIYPEPSGGCGGCGEGGNGNGGLVSAVLLLLVLALRPRRRRHATIRPA
jgi:hypothetical protein